LSYLRRAVIIVGYYLIAKSYPKFPSHPENKFYRFVFAKLAFNQDPYIPFGCVQFDAF
jgi:hypothetical protein